MLISNILLSAGSYGAGTVWKLIIILQGACFGGGVARFIYCMIRIMYNEDEAVTNKKRAVHAVIFTVIGTCALQIANVILSYFGVGAISG